MKTSRVTAFLRSTPSQLSFVILAVMASHAAGDDAGLSSALDEAYTKAVEKVDEQRETLTYRNRTISIEPVADGLVEEYGVELLPLLQSRIEERCALDPRVIDGDDSLKLHLELMTVAKIGYRHDVTEFFASLWESTEEAYIYQMLISISLLHLPPEQCLHLHKVRLENGDFLTARMLTEVGDQEILDLLEQYEREERLAIDDVNLNLMRTRLSQPQEIQQKWILLDLRYRMWLLTAPDPKFPRHQYTTLVGRGVAGDSQMPLTSDYLVALSKSIDKDFHRWKQLMILSVALAERGDEHSEQILQDVADANHLVARGLLTRDFQGGERALLLMLHPGGPNNTAIMKQLGEFGNERTAATLDELSFDESYSDAEREVVKQTRIEILDRLLER